MKVLDWYLKKIPKHHKDIIKGSILLVAFIIVSKLTGVLKDVIVAAELGVGLEMDTFMYAFTLSTMIVNPLVQTIINCISTSQSEIDTNAKLEEFQGTVNLLVLIIGGLLLISQHLAMPSIIELISDGKNSLEKEKLETYSKILNLYIPLSLIIAVSSTRMLMRKQHINTLLESLPAVCTIFSCLFWMQKIDGITLISGFLIGSFLQWMLMEIDQYRRIRRISLSCKFSTEILNLTQRVCWMLPAMILTTSTIVVDHMMASWLGTGYISTLGYATKVLAILLTLTQTVVGRSVMPVLGEIRSNPVLLEKTVKQWMYISIVGSTLLAGMMAIFAEPLINLLFERGKFSTQETIAVRNVLWAYLLQTPFYLGSTILFIERVIKGKQRELLNMGVLVFLFNIVLNHVLSSYLSVVGIALSTSICYFIQWLYLYKKR